MMELFSALSFLVLILGAILVVVLHRLDSVEDTERKELQKLVNEIVD